MAIYLKNSMFIHIPKCGGRFVSAALKQLVDIEEVAGDPVHDAHATPDSRGKQVFCFVREPATFAHSLWHHRARKKVNRLGHRFNWQDHIRLEVECRENDYHKFMDNVANNPDCVADYYKFYIGKYENVQFGRMENLTLDLLGILDANKERYNKIGIWNSRDTIVGKNPIQEPIDPVIRNKINRNNAKFCQALGYSFVN